MLNLDIKNCTTERLHTIYELAQANIRWIVNDDQLKEITKELERRGVMEYLRIKNR